MVCGKCVGSCMNPNGCRPGSSEELVALVDTFLGPTASYAEFKTVPRIAIAFCKATDRPLEERQRKALYAAERFLLGDTSLHAASLSEVANHMDRTVHDPHVSKAERSMERLVWCALVTHSELSGYACEFLVALGEDIGLDLNVMTDIVVRTVPGMAEWCAARDANGESL